MIEIKMDELLKDTLEYEDYSENICNLSIEELKKEGLIKCGGCCRKDKSGKNSCQECKNKKNCKK